MVDLASVSRPGITRFPDRSGGISGDSDPSEVNTLNRARHTHQIPLRPSGNLVLALELQLQLVELCDSLTAARLADLGDVQIAV